MSDCSSQCRPSVDRDAVGKSPIVWESRYKLWAKNEFCAVAAISYWWDSLHARTHLFSFLYNLFLFPHLSCVHFSDELASRFILTFILWSIHLERNQSDEYMKRWWWRLLLFCTENRIDFLAQASHRELSWPRRDTVVRRNDAPEIPRHYYCCSLSTFMRPLHGYLIVCRARNS